MFRASSAILLLLGFAVMAHSKPLHQRFIPRRGLARQVQASLPTPAPTGYPEAGITPEVPFDLPSSTVQPQLNYLPPDNTYGPPDSVYGPPRTIDEEVQPEPEQPIEADDVPEDAPPADTKNQLADEDEEEVLVQVSDDGTVIAVSSTLDQPDSSKPARFYQRFPQGRRSPQPVPQRLVLRRNW